MNKVYTIGRDSTCDIVIMDPTDVVSRLHATLKVNGNGKYMLIDQSTNGTYVNGIRMTTNEEVPVTRKDVISFAHIRDLDWNKIPKEKNSKLIWIASVVAVLVIACICFFVFSPKPDPVVEQHNAAPQDPVTTKVEAPIVEKKDTAAKETIYVKEKTVKKQKTKTGKTENDEKQENKKEIAPTNDDKEEVVNPLL